MNVYPISFYWIDQNEDIAAAMGWRWLAALGKKCVEQERETSWDRRSMLGRRRLSGFGVYVAEMRALPPYTYPNDADPAPIYREYGESVPPPPPITLHCALVHALVSFPAAAIDDLDAWNVALITTGEELNREAYPRHPDGEWLPQTFAAWRAGAWRAIRDWQYKESRWLPMEAFHRKVLP